MPYTESEGDHARSKPAHSSLRAELLDFNDPAPRLEPPAANSFAVFDAIHDD